MNTYDGMLTYGPSRQRKNASGSRSRSWSIAASALDEERAAMIAARVRCSERRIGLTDQLSIAAEHGADRRWLGDLRWLLFSCFAGALNAFNWKFLNPATTAQIVFFTALSALALPAVRRRAGDARPQRAEAVCGPAAAA